MRFAWYCTCGDSMVGSVSPADAIYGLEAAFDHIHRGPGHGRTDRLTAQRARRRTDCRTAIPRHRPTVPESASRSGIQQCSECGGWVHRVWTQGGWFWRHDPGTFWRAHA